MTPPTIYETPRPAGRPGETVVTSTCGHNCGGRCVVNAHVVGDRIVRITTDPRRWSPELPPLHACVRGFGAMERVHHPDRLTIPCGESDPGAPASGRASRGTRRSTPWRGSSGASATPTGRPRSSTPPDRAPLRAPQPRHRRAAPPPAGRLHGALVESLRGGRGLRRPLHVRAGHPLHERRARARRLRELARHSDVGLEPGRRALRHGNVRVSPVGPPARHAARLRGPAPDADQPGPGRRARLHPAVDGRGGAHRDDAGHRGGGPPGPGVPRPAGARLRRGSSPARRAPGGLVPRVPHGGDGRRSEDARVGGPDHGRPRGDPPAARDRVRDPEAGGDPLRLRAGADRVRGAVPPRGVRPRGGHRQRRRVRRQLRL